MAAVTISLTKFDTRVKMSVKALQALDAFDGSPSPGCTLWLSKPLEKEDEQAVRDDYPSFFGLWKKGPGKGLPKQLLYRASPRLGS